MRPKHRRNRRPGAEEPLGQAPDDGMTMRFKSMRWLGLGAALLTLAACGSRTPAGVAEATTIDFAEVANYAAPTLPAYFDETVAALDNSPPSTAADDRVATLGRVLFYDLRLSTNGRASCASCHQQKHGF